MVKVAIVDDETVAINETIKCLNRYAGEKNAEFSITCFKNSVDFLENYGNKYDVVFLDIQMADYDGLEVAKKIRKTDKATIIIFITNMANLAVRGYEVDALDFIVKPLEYFSFSVKMDRVMSRLSLDKEDEFILTTDKGIVKIFPSSIKYVEVFKHTLIYHTTEGDFSAYGSLVHVENTLAGNGFTRCNNCYLVNLRFVKRVDNYDLYLSGGKEETLTISQSKKKEFMKKLNEYIGQGKIHVL